MKLLDMLKLGSLAKARVVAGAEGLSREVFWAHVVDMPDPIPWVKQGVFLLTSGYSWPRTKQEQSALIRALARQGLAGVGLAVPRFFDRMPEAACKAAEESSFPLLEIPWEVPFSSITEEVHETILSEQYRIIKTSETIHRELTQAALDAEHLQDIALTLGRLVKRVLTIFDAEGRVLSSYSHRNAEFIEEEFVRTALEQGKSLSGMVHYMEQRGWIVSTHSKPKYVRIESVPGIQTVPRFIFPIFIKRELAGYLSILEGETVLSELDIRAAEHAVTVIALHISQQRALASLEAQLGYSFLDSLLEGRFNGNLQALQRAQLFGFNPEGVYSIGMIVIDASVPLSREGLLIREGIADQLRRRLKELEVPILVSVAQNHIYFLLPEKYSAIQIWKRIGGHRLSCAVSRLHKGVSGIMLAYAEVQSMRSQLKFGQYHEYDDLLIPRILMGDKEAHDAFLDQLFKSFQRIKNGTVLIETLLATARAGFHLKKTAEKLCIHPKTLRYRLDRAMALSGLDLNDTGTRFDLQLAAQILSLSDNKSYEFYPKLR